MSDTLVIIPTYNEIENIEKMIHTVFSLEKEFHVLIVDDNSPDKTAEKVKEYLEANYRREQTLDEAVDMALKALIESVDKIDEGWTARLVTIPTSTKRYTPMPIEELRRKLEPLIKEKRG